LPQNLFRPCPTRNNPIYVLDTHPHHQLPVDGLEIVNSARDTPEFGGTGTPYTLMSTGLVIGSIIFTCQNRRRRKRGVVFSCQQLCPMVGVYYRLYDKGFGLRYRSLAYYTMQPHPSGLAKIFTLKPIASNTPYRHNHDRPSPSARYRRTQNSFFYF
jgi:hypothetical protein